MKRTEKKEYFIAVLDIGKTNKKVMIYDHLLRKTDEHVQVIEEFRSTEYEPSGLMHDNIAEIKRFFFSSLKKISQKYHIKAVSVTTHGATYVCVNQKGEITVPEISYTSEPGDDFHREFYREFGKAQDLQQTTATPDFMALINIAKSLYYAKKKFPAAFADTKYILNYPQYWGFLLTGKAGSESTYMGCHTYLWDFTKNSYSSVAEKLGITGKLPPEMKKPWDILGTVTPGAAEETGLDQDTIVTYGIHDSNSSLLPYLISMDDDFVLNSTGTWCVLMHKKDRVSFKKDELGKIVFFNLSAFGAPVKTSIFMGGLEFETYLKLLQKINNRTDHLQFNASLLEEIISKKNAFILPSITKGTGQFPDSPPRIVEAGKVYPFAGAENGSGIPPFFMNYEKAYAVLVLSVAAQTKVALDRADMYDGIQVFTEGGFRKNTAYNRLLTALYPNSSFYLTSLDEATAFGAAILGKAAVEKIQPESMKNLFSITKKPVEPFYPEGMSAYLNSFLSQV